MSTALPEHATAEIEAAKGKQKAELKKLWAAWAAVGDAKTAEREAFAEVVASQLAFATCRAALKAKNPGKSLPPGACDCGKHYQPAVKAQKTREKALVSVERAITSYKAGG